MLSLVIKAFFMQMINFNGTIKKDADFQLSNNSAFLYGDALFDTLILKNNTCIFLEAHYFRLVASMRQLRMEIPSFFTQDYWENEIQKLVKANQLNEARIRTTIYRDNESLLIPKSNSINFLIHITPLTYQTKSTYKLGIYKDNYLTTNDISSIKTTNRIPNILAGIYASENDLDNCILLNHKKQVAEAYNANIFILQGNEIKTPALGEGCIDGIVRKKLLALLDESVEYNIVAGKIDTYELLKADEIFLSNSVFGLQSVSHFKKKVYKSELAKELNKSLEAQFY